MFCRVSINDCTIINSSTHHKQSLGQTIIAKQRGASWNPDESGNLKVVDRDGFPKHLRDIS